MELFFIIVAAWIAITFLKGVVAGWKNESNISNYQRALINATGKYCGEFGIIVRRPISGENTYGIWEFNTLRHQFPDGDATAQFELVCNEHRHFVEWANANLNADWDVKKLM